MKTIKVFILVGLFFLLASAGATAYVWNLLQNSFQEQSDVEIGGVKVGEAVTTGSQAVSEGITITTESLTQGQRALAEKVGFTEGSFTISPEMIECGESKLGESRLQEIADGDTPSLLESVSLAGCLK